MIRHNVGKLLMFALLSAGLVVTSLPTTTAALSLEHEQQIQARCQSVQTVLRRLHQSDGISYVNRSQLYEYISSKLMAPLNSRVALNRLDGTKLVAATAQYEKALAAFRNEYRTYEMQLNDTLRINCVAQPTKFYTSIADAREYRQKVADRVKEIQTALAEYNEAFDAFKEKI